MSMAKSFLSGVKSLHEAIEEGLIEEVKILLSKLPVDKQYFDVNNISAAAVAIKWEKHEIYELLVAKGIFLGPHEWMDDATYGQKRSRKENLRDIHRRYFNDPNQKHLINLITSTQLSHEASPSERREHLRLITEAFEDLNGLKSIEPILKVASTSPKLRIVFDFNRDSVEFLDPVKKRNIMGTCYTDEGIIYIGAKYLKRTAEMESGNGDMEQNEGNRCEVLGVLIHELTHFVMEILYNNECKPFQCGNQEKLNEFSQVVDVTAAKKESEPYIESVYNFPESRHHAELIVRVPHLTALYKDDADMTIEVQEKFSELFKFFEKNTLVDLKRQFPMMEVKHELRELNELCGTLTVLEESDIEMTPQALDGLDLNSLSNDNILFISSNCPQLTLSAIYQQVRNDINFATFYIFADLKSMRNAKIFDLAAKALFALSTNLSLVIDCQGDVKFDAVMRIIEKLNDKKINQKVIFVLDKSFEAPSDVQLFEVVHSWNHLASNFQQKLEQTKIEFNGTVMLLKAFLNDLSSIGSIPFHALLNDQTIVIGMNHKFESSEKLVERKFLPSYSKIIDDSDDFTIEHDLDELLTLAKEHETILISDEPGMGKSTSLKMLHSKLRQMNPSLWLVFMDLKENFEAYQNSCLKIHKREDIAKFLTQKILKIEGFEAQVFTQLFNEDRVSLLMDGLDEVCPSYKQFIFSLMKDIQKFSKNQLWISTRPHLAEELKEELNPIVFTLKPFTAANRREYFEKHFNENQNSKLKEIESFLEKLKPYRDQTNVVCNPLVLGMIVEILDADRNLNLSEANLFDIYDRFTRKMVEKCNTDKGQEAQKDIAKSFGNSNVVEFYQQQAFLTCFEDDAIASRRQKLIDSQFDHVLRPPLHEIVRVGLMYASSSGNLHFIHRTFAEFYIAKFFYEEIFRFTNLRAEKHLNNAIEFLLTLVLEVHGYEFIKILLDNALESDKGLTVKNFPASTLKVMQEGMELEHLEFLVFSGCCNLIKFIVLHLHPDGQKLLFSKNLNSWNLLLDAIKYQSVDFIKRFFALLNDLNADEFRKMFFELDEYSRNVIFFAASNPNSVFKFIVEFCETFMTSGELNELFMQTGRLDKTILHSALRKDLNVDIIIEVLTQKLGLTQQKTLLKEMTAGMSYSLLQFAAESKNSIANYESLLTFIRKVFDLPDKENFLLHQDINGFKAFDFALTSENELVFEVIRNFYLEVLGKEKMREIILNRNNLEHWIQKDSSLYFLRIVSRYAYHDGAFKRFLSFLKELFALDSIQKEFLLTKGEDGELFLKFAVMDFGIEDFTVLCSLLEKNLEIHDRMEILQQKNFHGENAFHWAARRKNLDIFKKIRELYQESFDEQSFRKMIVSCDKSWILDVIEIREYENSETFTELCSYLKDVFKDTEETEILKDFFYFADKSGQTAFMAAAEGQEFEDLFALSKELFTIETVKEFLLLKDINGATAFTHSFMKDVNRSFVFVKSVFEELFEREQMQKTVLANVQNENVLSLSIELKSRLDLFEVFCNYLIKLYKDEPQKLKIFFTTVDSSNETALMKAAKHSGGKYLEVLINVIEKVFVKEDVEDILSQRNQEGKTAFHFLIGNFEDEIFETVKNFYIKTLGNEAMENIILGDVDWTRVLDIYKLESDIKRLVPLLKSLFVEVSVHLKNIFLKPFEGHTIKEEMKSHWKDSRASTVSYLKEQFQDDEQIKMFIMDLESIGN